MYSWEKESSPVVYSPGDLRFCNREVGSIVSFWGSQADGLVACIPCLLLLRGAFKPVDREYCKLGLD